VDFVALFLLGFPLSSGSLFCPVLLLLQPNTQPTLPPADLASGSVGGGGGVGIAGGNPPGSFGIVQNHPVLSVS
jgi:hypothetical protein